MGTQYINARNLFIMWGEDQRYWEWLDKNNENKTEIAKLKQVWWFDIRAKVYTKTLGKKVGYTAYLVYDLEESTTGLDTVKVSVRYSQKIDNSNEGYSINLKKKMNPGDKGVFPTTRASDGRLEVELGQFHTNYCGGNDEIIEVWVFDIDTSYPKAGIQIVGVEIRPY